MSVTGRRTINTIKVLEVDTSPASGGGVAAPIGSIAGATDGSGLYVKTSSSNTGWTAPASGGGGSSGADVKLSNLLSTTINTALLPVRDDLDGYNIGDSNKRWHDGYFSHTMNIGGTSTTQAGVLPSLWVQNNTSGKALFSFMNTISGGATEIILGQATDITDGNYTGLYNANSGLVTDGLLEAGTSSLGANSSLTNAKLLLYTENARPIVFATGGHGAANECMRIQSSGNLSIGGTTPLIASSKLYIESTSTNDTVTIRNTAASGEAQLRIINNASKLAYFTVDGSSLVSTFLGSATANVFQIQTNTEIAIGNTVASALRLGTNSAEALRVDSSQNVVIGTASAIASTKLTVQTNGLTNTQISAKEVNANGTGGIYLLNDSNHRVGLGIYGTTYSASTLFGISPADYATYVATSTQGLLLGTDTSSPIIIGTNNIERMRITNGGEFDIGSTSVSSISTKMFVKSNGTTASLVLQSANTSDQTSLVLLDSTGGKQIYIDANGSGSGVGYFGLSGNGLGVILAYQTSNFALGTLDSQDIIIGTNNIERQRILGSGQHQYTPQILTYSATTNLDFSLPNVRTLSLTGDVTFTTSNLANGRSMTIRIDADSTPRNLTFPAGWKFLGSAAPTVIASSATAMLVLNAFGNSDSNVLAAYSVTP